MGLTEFRDDMQIVEVGLISIDHRYQGRGHARGALLQLMRLADAYGYAVALTPDDSFGASVPRLRRFYKSLGFVENRGRNKDFSISESMYRMPKRAS